MLFYMHTLRYISSYLHIFFLSHEICKFIQKEVIQILKLYYYSFITTIKYKYIVFPDAQKVIWLFRVENLWKSKFELCSEREHTKFFQLFYFKGFL